MKSRRPKSEQQADARHDLKAVEEALRKPLVQGGLFDYAARSRQVQEAQRWNSLASQLRFRSPVDAHVWDVHRATAERLWEAVEAAYPPGFWDDYQCLERGEAKGVEGAIKFLEADPYFFRSGYLKEKLIRLIKRPMLTPARVTRLQAVVLNMVDHRDGREFRAFCRLAHKVDAPALREQLTQRLTRGDPDTRRRARWVLEALEQNRPRGTQG